MSVNDFKTYFSTQDVIVFIGIFTVVFLSFRLFEVDIPKTACSILVMYVVYHFHVHARQQTFDDIEKETEDLINARIPMQSISEVNDARFVTHLHDMLYLQQYNEYEFRNGMIHIDNFLRLYLDVVKRGVVFNKHHTENAEEEKKKALNSFMGIMVSVPAYTNTELSNRSRILQNPVDYSLYRQTNALEHLLEEYMFKMAKTTNKEWKYKKTTQSNHVSMNRPKPDNTHEVFSKYEVFV